MYRRDGNTKPSILRKGISLLYSELYIYLFVCFSTTPKEGGIVIHFPKHFQTWSLSLFHRARVSCCDMDSMLISVITWHDIYLKQCFNAGPGSPFREVTLLPSQPHVFVTYYPQIILGPPTCSYCPSHFENSWYQVHSCPLGGLSKRNIDHKYEL